MALCSRGGADLNAKALDVIVAGEFYVDLILSGFDSLPQLGRESFASSFRREIGGGTAITACGLARLGARTGVCGAVGADSGAWVQSQLAARGVDVSGMWIDPSEPTGTTVIASTKDDRAMLSYAGANSRLLRSLLEDVETLLASRTRHVHLACPPDAAALKRLLEMVHQNHCTLSLDVGWHEDWLSNADIRKVMPEVDIFFPNETEAACMTGEKQPDRMLQVFRSAGMKRVALKLGARGSALLWDGEVLFADARPVQPVDTTGAGDCFDAGFLHAWLNGMPPATCLQRANICGALSTQEYGGIGGFPSAEQIEAELERQDP